MEYRTIALANTGAIARLRVNRPDKLNALNETVLRELLHALNHLAETRELRVVILSGAGEKAFVAGADISTMENFSDAEAKAFAELGHQTMDAVEALPVPVIARVQGFALGGGCELALACDFIYAAEKAKFGQPEVNLGVIPGFGGTQRLARRVGIAQARELIYSGATIGASEALRIGLVNRVAADAELDAEVEKLAQTIASKGPFAVREAKRVLRIGEEKSLGEANSIERDGFAHCFVTQDQKEGMRAFLEKRAANFENR